MLIYADLITDCASAGNRKQSQAALFRPHGPAPSIRISGPLQPHQCRLGFVRPAQRFTPTTVSTDRNRHSRKRYNSPCGCSRSMKPTNEAVMTPPPAVAPQIWAQWGWHRKSLKQDHSVHRTKFTFSVGKLYFVWAGRGSSGRRGNSSAIKSN